MGSIWIVALVMAPVLLVGIGLIALVSRLDRELEAKAEGKDDAVRWVNIV